VDGHATEMTSVTLRRGPCFGTCPVYEVTLAADGTASWNGERFVDRLGRHQGQLNPNDFQRLAGLVARVGFFDWAPDYVAGVTDTPDHVLTVAAVDQVKTVRQNGVDEPADFWVIATVLDRLAETVDWAPASPEVACHDWTAVQAPGTPGPSVLTVHGTCALPTPGHAVELRRREPQGFNPRDLQLERVVHPPVGPAAQVVTEVDVTYTEHTGVDYQTVTILPDGPSVGVESSQAATAEGATPAT
jgi:Domain of unknown function (DUF6438)